MTEDSVTRFTTKDHATIFAYLLGEALLKGERVELIEARARQAAHYAHLQLLEEENAAVAKADWLASVGGGCHAEY